MTIYFFSDSHFYHHNIIKYCGRPTNCDDIMWEKLKTIGPEDTLIHLGDVCFSKDRKETEELFQRLPGKTKILIKGNHDKKRPILKCPWDLVTETYEFEHSGLRFYLQHRPFVDFRTAIEKWLPPVLFYPLEERLRKNITLPKADVCIHGHLHEKGQRYGWLNNVLIVNGCVEHWSYRPFSLEEVVVEYHARKKYIEAECGKRHQKK
jgi:calcineurin-like phosphoesterase family protein